MLASVAIIPMIPGVSCRLINTSWTEYLLHVCAPIIAIVDFRVLWVGLFAPSVTGELWLIHRQHCLCIFVPNHKACWGWLYCRSTSAIKTSSHHCWIQVWPPHLLFLSARRALKYSPCVWMCEWCCKIHLPLAYLHLWYDAVAYWFCLLGLCHEMLMLCYFALLKLWLVLPDITGHALVASKLLAGLACCLLLTNSEE